MSFIINLASCSTSKDAWKWNCSPQRSQMHMCPPRTFFFCLYVDTYCEGLALCYCLTLSVLEANRNSCLLLSKSVYLEGFISLAVLFIVTGMWTPVRLWTDYWSETDYCTLYGKWLARKGTAVLASGRGLYFPSEEGTWVLKPSLFKGRWHQRNCATKTLTEEDKYKRNTAEMLLGKLFSF